MLGTSPTVEINRWWEDKELAQGSVGSESRGRVWIQIVALNHPARLPFIAYKYTRTSYMFSMIIIVIQKIVKIMSLSGVWRGRSRLTQEIPEVPGIVCEKKVQICIHSTIRNCVGLFILPYGFRFIYWYMEEGHLL